VADLVSARVGDQADVTVTAALGALAMTAVRDERGGRWHLDHDIDQISPTDKHQAAVAAHDEHLVLGCIDGVVVGYGLAYLSPTTTGQLCMINEIVVHPEAQAIGVGSAVLAEVRAWAIEESCQAIESQVLPGNRAAKNFFERVGMKTRKMRVSADLG
jgi:ribosomal protein S18 acetylase RimI-like enzyme